MITPVTLPPGRFRLATRPSLTGSPPIVKTIGIVVVAALAASAAGVPPARRSRRPDGGPDRPPVPAVDRIDRPPSDIRSRRSGPRRSRASFRPLRNAATRCAAVAGRRAAEEPDHRHRRLLRARRERPRGRRAAEQRDELAPLHSITSSARASSVGGTSRPSALAVLRLITSSYLVGACTGRSAGFSPLRMRST